MAARAPHRSRDRRHRRACVPRRGAGGRARGAWRAVRPGHRFARPPVAGRPVAPADPLHPFGAARPARCSAALQALLSLGLGLFDAWRALGRIGPAAVVGFGGYASVPTMSPPACAGTPAMVHEQNAVLGKANRGAGRRVAGGDLFRPSPASSTTTAPAWSAIRCASRCAPARARLSRAGPGSRHRPAGVRRQPGRASFSQVIPEAILSLPPPMRAGCASCSSAGPRTSSASARSTCRPTSWPSWRRSSPTCRSAWPARIW